VLQCVAVCCSVVLCVAAWCCVLQCGAVYYQHFVTLLPEFKSSIGFQLCMMTVTCVLQCVAVCCSVLQCVAVCCSVLQCVVHDDRDMYACIELIGLFIYRDLSTKSIATRIQR